MYALQFSVSITVTVGGLLISGQPITPAEFFGLAGEALGEAWKRVGEGASPWTEYFGKLRSQAQEQVQDSAAKRQAIADEIASSENPPAVVEETLADAQRLLPTYLHLKNVLVYGAQPTPLRLPLWRGRLTEITGWNFGQITL